MMSIYETHASLKRTLHECIQVDYGRCNTYQMRFSPSCSHHHHNRQVFSSITFICFHCYFQTKKKTSHSKLSNLLFFTTIESKKHKLDHPINKNGQRLLRKQCNGPVWLLLWQKKHEKEYEVKKKHFQSFFFTLSSKALWATYCLKQ